MAFGLDCVVQGCVVGFVLAVAVDLDLVFALAELGLASAVAGLVVASAEADLAVVVVVFLSLTFCLLKLTWDENWKKFLRLLFVFLIAELINL